MRRLKGGRPGFIPEFAAGDGRIHYRVSAAVLRRNVSRDSLPSANFSVRDVDETFVFEGRGHGHGVGLCQWGARGCGLEGWNCFDILRHYYPDSRVVILQR